MAMNPAPRIRAMCTATLSLYRVPLQQCRYASVVSITPSGSIEHIQTPMATIEQYPPTQPPSLKPPDLRKSQLLRQYASLLRSTPLTIFFQHNNIKANEWAAIRRELRLALRAVSSSHPPAPGDPDAADAIRFQVIRTTIFTVALRIAEFHDPLSAASSDQKQAQQDPTAPIHATEQATTTPTHSLSPTAYEATLAPSALERRRTSNKKFDINPRAHNKRSTPLDGLLRGPIAALTFPTVTPQHLAAALSILAPTPGASSAFPAPRRKASPGYYEPGVQSGLQKLLMLGARVEGRVLDGEGVKWVGGLAGQGGLEGLRAQLVQMLQGAGAGLTGVLESAGKNLWVTMEGRRISLEEDQGGEKKDKGEESDGS